MKESATCSMNRKRARRNFDIHVVYAIYITCIYTAQLRFRPLGAAGLRQIVIL